MVMMLHAATRRPLAACLANTPSRSSFFYYLQCRYRCESSSEVIIDEAHLNHQRKLAKLLGVTPPSLPLSSIDFLKDSLDAMVSPSSAHHKIQHLRSDVKQYCCNGHVNQNLIDFGSQKSGIGLTSSDVDLAIVCNVNVKKLSNHRNYVRNIIIDKSRILGEHKNCFSVKDVVLQAKVPIVQFVHLPTGLHADLSIRVDDYKRTDGHSDMLCAFGVLSEEFIPLAVLVKHWAVNQGICVPFSGDMGGFAYTLLVVSFLQSRKLLPKASLEKVNSGSLVNRKNPIEGGLTIARRYAIYNKVMSREFSDWSDVPPRVRILIARRHIDFSLFIKATNGLRDFNQAVLKLSHMFKDFNPEDWKSLLNVQPTFVPDLKITKKCPTPRFQRKNKREKTVGVTPLTSKSPESIIAELQYDNLPFALPDLYRDCISFIKEVSMQGPLIDVTQGTCEFNYQPTKVQCDDMKPWSSKKIEVDMSRWGMDSTCNDDTSYSPSTLNITDPRSRQNVASRFTDPRFNGYNRLQTRLLLLQNAVQSALYS